MKQPPGSEFPYFLQVLQILFNPTDTLDRWSEKYGNTIKLGGNKHPLSISFSSPEAIKTVFNTSPDKIGYVQKSQIVKAILGGDSFIFLPEEEHQRQKRLIGPSFQDNVIETYGQDIADVTKKSFSSRINSSVEVFPLMKEISLSTIIRAIFGDEKESLNSIEIRETIAKTFEVITSSTFLLDLFLRNTINSSFIHLIIGKSEFEKLREYTKYLIEKEIEYHEDLKPNNSLLSSLVKSKNENQSINKEEIYSTVMTIIFAGFETSAAALSWMIYWVCYLPEIRQNIEKEIHSSFGIIEHKNITENFPYLSAVCKETLRINPPALSAFSRTVKQKIEIEEYTLEPGTNIDVSIYLAHKNKSIYPEPNKFKPERFLCNQYSSYEYLPFGGGQCRCLGANLVQYSMKIVLYTLIKNFSFEMLHPRLIKPKPRGIILVPSGLEIKVTGSKTFSNYSDC